MNNQHPPIGLSGLPSSWATSAMNSELAILANLPKKEQGRKIGKPNSLFSVCLLKIASICKGDGIDPQEAMNAVKAACSSYLWLRDSEINRQFSRAWKRATPRQGNSLPITSNTVESYPTSRLENRTKPRFMVNELDLTTGLSRSYALLEGEPAAKAHQLITDVKNLLTAGVLPSGDKYSLTARKNKQWAIPTWEVRLSFSKATPILIKIIECVVIHFCGILESRNFGAFTLAIPHDERLLPFAW